MGCNASKTQTTHRSTHTPQQNSTKEQSPGQVTFKVTEAIANHYTFSPLKQDQSLRTYIKKATDRNNRIVSIVKVYQCSSLTPTQIASLYRNINTLINLNHINVQRISTYYYADKVLYVIQDYYTGDSLLTKLDKVANLPSFGIRDMFIQIVAGLKYLHDEGLFHGDLRLEHLVFDKPDMQLIKIIDFGISPSIKRVCQDWSARNNLNETYFKSPESFKGNTSQKSDIWALGCILFFLTSSHMPFEGKDVLSVKSQILRGVIHMDGTEWQHVDQKFKDLISKMLSSNPANRPTATEILNNPVFLDKSKLNQKPNKHLMKNLQTFKVQNDMQAATLQFMAEHMISETEKAVLLTEFQKIDINGDGQISKDELLQVYMKSMPNNQATEQVDQLFHRIDHNNSGKIDYNEFVMATINISKLMSREKLAKLFREIDKDHSGSLQTSEVLKLLRDMGVPPDKFNIVTRQLDKNGDGQISFDEFLEIMMLTSK